MIVVAIIQARMTSTRLPGKVLMDIDGKPMLLYVVKRIKWSKLIDEFVVATSTNQIDNPIIDFCKKNDIDYFRGNLEDVLSRYYFAAKKYKADIIVRVTSDCPLIDGTLIDEGLTTFKKSNVDYLSNTLVRTFPRGFDFEIFTFKALEKAFKEATSRFEREHVTPFIEMFAKKNRFNVKNMESNQDKSKYRITVDTKEDIDLIRVLIKNYRADSKNREEIIKILDNNPEIVKINSHVKQK